MARTKDARHSGFGLGIQLLEHLVDAPAPQGVSQVARELGLAVSTTHDTLHLLMELGMVEIRESTKTYQVTPHLLDFASHIARHFTLNVRVQQAMLEFCHEEGLSACICILDGHETRIAFASGPLGSTVVIGAKGPVYATSAGKALVSSLPESAWEVFMPPPEVVPNTPNTNTDPGVFRSELKKTVENGVAWNRQESESNIFSVASAIRGRNGEARHAVAIMFDAEDMPYVDEPLMENKVRKLAGALSKLL